MADPLEKIVHELQSQTCPPSVMRRVARRIGPPSARGHSSRRLPVVGLTGALAGLIALGALITWNDPPPRDVSSGPGAEAERDPTVIVQQAVGSFALVGHTLKRVASRAEDTLLESAAPSLLKSFRNAKSKVTNHL